MKPISTNSAAWITILAMALFWVFYVILTPEQLAELASSLVLGASLIVMLTWFTAAVQGVRQGARDGPGLLAMGVFGISTWVFLQRVWINILRWLDRPEWLLQTPISSLTAWGLFCGCMLIILAPGTERGAVPNRNYLWLLTAVAMGSLIAGITIGAFLVSA